MSAITIKMDEIIWLKNNNFTISIRPKFKFILQSKNYKIKYYV